MGGASGSKMKSVLAGIYIHIPFCSQFCTYCNFYSVKQLGLRERFVQAMVNEIKARKDFFKNIGSSVTTVYIGGGTPSVLLPHQLARIVDALTETFGLTFGDSGAENSGAENLRVDNSRVHNSRVQEFTIEVNPNDITPEYAAFLTSLGVNRVSMGMQSFDDSHLKWMNRRHTSSEGIQAYRILRQAGINNISLDLIFGYAPLSAQQWEKNIDTMISLAPEHISAYQMSIEPGSRLSAMSRNGSYTPPSDEECLRQYTLLQTKLSAAGYHQYEISNFARQKTALDGQPAFQPVFQPASQSVFQLASQSQPPTERCQWSAILSTTDAQASLYVSQHNSSYWDGTPYLGLGPAAHSYSGTGHVPQSLRGAGRAEVCGARRIWNTPSVKKYCNYYCGNGPAVTGMDAGSAAGNSVGIASDIAAGALVLPLAIDDIVGYEDLTLEDIFNETIMLGLRRTGGFQLDTLSSLNASLLREIMPDINRLVLSGQLIMEDVSNLEGAALGEAAIGGATMGKSAIGGAAAGKNIRIPADKLFISDSIIRELFV